VLATTLSVSAAPHAGHVIDRLVKLARELLSHVPPCKEVVQPQTAKSPSAKKHKVLIYYIYIYIHTYIHTYIHIYIFNAYIYALYIYIYVYI